MRRILLALVVVMAGNAGAVGFRSQLGGSKHFPSNGTSDVFRLVFPQSPGTVLTATNGQAVTYTRASAATCWRSGYTMTDLIANQFCALGGKLLFEGGPTTNLQIKSEEMENAAWTGTNASAIADQGTDPKGTSLADSVTSSVAGGYLETTTGVALTGGTSGHVAGSVWVRTTSGTGAVSIRVYDATAASVLCTGGGTATTTWQRFQCANTSATNANLHKLRIFPGGTAGTGTLLFFGAQLEQRNHATSYVKTTGSTATRAIAALTVSSSGFPLSEGAFVFEWEPAWQALQPPDGGVAYFLNTLQGAGNGISIGMTGTNSFFMDIRGSSGTFNVSGTGGNIAIGTTYLHRYEWEASSKAYRIYRDGALLSSGTHTLTFSNQNSTAYIGHNNAGARFAWGWISRLCLSTSTAGCR